MKCSLDIDMKVVFLHFVVQRRGTMRATRYIHLAFCIVAREAKAGGGVMGNSSQLHTRFSRLENGHFQVFTTVVYRFSCLCYPVNSLTSHNLLFDSFLV